MKPNLRFWAALTVAALCTGCVEQRYVITSDPPGAAVYRNGNLIGYTPVDDTFVYYGKYHFTLVKDGYETLQVDQDVPAPIYEYIGLDFLSEVLYPFNLRDVQRFNYSLREAQSPAKGDVLTRGQQLRDRGQTLLTQNPPPAATAPGLRQTAPPAPPLGAAAAGSAARRAGQPLKPIPQNRDTKKPPAAPKGAGGRLCGKRAFSGSRRDG